MSDTTALTELARFVGQSKAGEAIVGQEANASGSAQPNLRPAKRGVSDLLGVVLTLSARTRRTMMPKVEIDLDVFRPDGSRAVRLITPRR